MSQIDTSYLKKFIDSIDKEECEKENIPHFTDLSNHGIINSGHIRKFYKHSENIFILIARLLYSADHMIDVLDFSTKIIKHFFFSQTRLGIEHLFL